VLEAVKFPARIADLDTGLTDVDGNALPHFRIEISNKGIEEGEFRINEEIRNETAYMKTPISLWFFLAKNLYYIDTARRANLEELMYLGFLLVTLVNKPTVVKQRFAGSPKPDWPTTYLTR
jgi:hypothetical protein